MKKLWVLVPLVLLLTLAACKSTLLLDGSTPDTKPSTLPTESDPAEPSADVNKTASLLMDNLPAFPLKFTVTKFCADGSEQGNYDIMIEADKIEEKQNKVYLAFRISDFDSHIKIVASKNESGYAGEVFTKWDGYYYVQCFGSDEWWRVCFDATYDCWAIYCDNGKPFYVGSITGEHTNEELIAYFRLN